MKLVATPMDSRFREVDVGVVEVDPEPALIGQTTCVVHGAIATIQRLVGFKSNHDFALIGDDETRWTFNVTQSASVSSSARGITVCVKQAPRPQP